MRGVPSSPAPGRSLLFERVLPVGPVVRELRGAGDPASLLAEEARVVASSVENRRREFAAGRTCARAALAGLGVDAGPILPGPGRAPTWPDVLVGSITHCEGLAAAVVAPARTWSGLGIDAEPAAPLPRQVVRVVMNAAEVAALERLPRTVPWDRVLFSAKESLYKVWFPLRRTWLGFDEAVVSPAEDGTFTARLTRQDIGCIPREVQGRWAIADRFVATAIALSR
ncbi:MAG: 4'-phosphopantetheinyl transferase family protein [Dermatophilaceae bacterium]